MQELFSLQTNYGLKSFNGPLKVPHLGELGMLEPQIANNYYKRIFETLPSDDYEKFMDEFDTIVLDHEDQFYHWRLAGNNMKTVRLVDWEDHLGAKPASVGLNGQSFYLYFEERFFDPNDYIAGHYPDDYQIQVKEVEEISKSLYKYRVILDTDNPSQNSVPSSALEIGSRWSKEYNFQPMERSSRGTRAYFNTFIEMKTRASLMRMEYQIDGNMISKGKNTPLVFGFPDPTNPSNPKAMTGAFINFYDLVAIYQFKKQRAKAFLFSKKNYDKNEQYYNFDSLNGARIEAFSGMFEQIAPTNIHPYSSLNLDAFVDMAIENGLAMKVQDKYVLKLQTGAYGKIDISRWIENRSAQYTPNWTTAFIDKKGNEATYQNPVFSGFKSYNGVEIEVTNRTFFDDPERNKLKHPTEPGLVSSRNILITDYISNAGIKKLQVKGYENGIYRFIAGMRDPFSAGGMGTGSNSKAPVSSSVDQYEVHGMEFIGCIVEDPTKILYAPYNIA